MRLKDKVAIVVGAGQSPGEGIGNGRATALTFAREGAKVLCVDRDLKSAQETVDLKLPIDHDDSHVWNYRDSFAILLHGTQKAGSQASKDWQAIKSTTGGYKADYFKATKN